MQNILSDRVLEGLSLAGDLFFGRRDNEQKSLFAFLNGWEPKVFYERGNKDTGNDKCYYNVHIWGQVGTSPLRIYIDAQKQADYYLRVRPRRN